MTTGGDDRLGRLDEMLEEARREARQRIADWVREHRRAIELGDDVVMYRDGFDSESLLEFIEGENK